MIKPNYISFEIEGKFIFKELDHNVMSMTNCIEAIMDDEGLTEITYLSRADGILNTAFKTDNGVKWKSP